MRKACIFVHGIEAGIFEELDSKRFKFSYYPDYQGAPVSLIMPLVNN